VGLIGLLCVAIGVASATLDIAYDGYTVEVLRKDEHGVAVGSRLALYRAAMWVTGRLAITLAALWSWAAVNLALAFLYIPTVLVAWRAPEPEEAPPPARSLREAVWEPFLDLLAQHRALEILAFVVLFKLSDNLTQALTGPFLLKVGFSSWDVGVGAGTVALFAIIGGTFLGGLLTQTHGLGPALWITGFLQVFSNLGYAAVAHVGPDRAVMYAAQVFEYVTTGMGSGAFGVLLLRLTRKRFSSTQFALLSSLFSIPRVVAGPPAALLADALGWRDFFVLTLVFGVPGLVFLKRFAPWGVRDPEFQVMAARRGAPVSRAALVGAAAGAGVAAAALGLLVSAAIAAIKPYRAGQGYDLGRQLSALVPPGTWGDGLTLLGACIFGAAVALSVAAVLVARRGIRDAAGMEGRDQA
jgi:PAT family beta-lactamase induction signal transducer AmpG